MTRVQIDRKSLAGVFKVLKSVADDVRKEVRIVISKTANKVKLECARELKKQVPVPVKVLKKTILLPRTLPRGDRLIRTVYFNAGYPIPLKYFRARQNKKGVGYNAGQALGGRQNIPSAFIVKKYGGNVFKRQTKQRQSLKKIDGPTPAEAYEKANIVDHGKRIAQGELPKQVKERLRFLTLKAQGKLKR